MTIELLIVKRLWYLSLVYKEIKNFVIRVKQFSNIETTKVNVICMFLVLKGAYFIRLFRGGKKHFHLTSHVMSSTKLGRKLFFKCM